MLVVSHCSVNVEAVFIASKFVYCGTILIFVYW